MRVTTRLVLVLALALALGHGGPAGGATTFTVSRVQVFLSAKVKSEVLTVRNVSPETLRFQLSAFAWDQSRQGEIILAPTRDIVFFPPLFTLAPGAERNIRIGAATPPAASEKTYRLFIEELPPTEAAGSSSPPGEVTIRTRLGIPIFLRPVKEVSGGGIEAVALRDGRVSFELRNTGNVHFVAQAIRITGYGQGGDAVVQGALEGWYVLAGATRVYDFELPRDKCPVVQTVAVEIKTAQTTFTGQHPVSPAACHQ